jgi:hypothetical protein
VNDQGLYWPNGRNLFRRRLPAATRVALWAAAAAAMLIAAAVVWRLA